jgi:endo-1,4-beta-mannosidase
MNRRGFLRGGTALAISSRLLAEPWTEARERSPSAKVETGVHRFGVNYTPSRNWWFCWNDWDANPIRRDLDAITALAADHLRILLIWPWFQPNPKWVSSLHLERLDQLLRLMAERHLDALITVFTGQLSGWYFLPPFNKPGEGFFADPKMWDAQELFLRELAKTVGSHRNVIGFDLGNEINTCWSAPTEAGDRWMARMFPLIDSVLPEHLNVNGVDHQPWFRKTTFSAAALARQRFPVMHCYPWWTGALKFGGPFDPPSVKLLAAMAAMIRSYAGSAETPIWAGEFNTCIEALTEKQQAQWLERSVSAAIDEGVGWFTYWDSHDVNRKFAFNPVEYSLGLLTNEGRVKEQGHMFRELARGYRGKPVRYPKSILPPPAQEPTVESTWHWLLEWMGWKQAKSQPVPLSPTDRIEGARCG